MSLQMLPRFVAHVDMLGMSTLTVNDPHRAWAALSRFAQARNDILQIAFTIVPTGETVHLSQRLAVLTFSDTVLAFSQSDELADLHAILILASELLCRSMSYSIPVRAGIAHGPFVFNLDEQLFAGPPLVEAYHLGESAQWLGVVLDETTARRARAIPHQSDRGRALVVEWDVSVKSSGTIRRQVLSWPESHRGNFQVNLPISASTFYKPFEHISGPWSSLPLTTCAKYESTVAFINAQLCGP